MPDPHAVFRGNERKQATLLALWPELHAALAGPAQPVAEKIIHCVILPCPDATPRPRAVARTRQHGHPACAMHIVKFASRPGGWPLNTREES